MIAYDHAPYKKNFNSWVLLSMGMGAKSLRVMVNLKLQIPYIKKYGADVLRLWVCSEDFRRDIPLSDEILGSSCSFLSDPFETH